MVYHGIMHFHNYVNFLIFSLILLFPLSLFGDVIYLRDGRVIKGQISRQTINQVEIITQDNRVLVIQKRDIQKILYVSEEELRRIEEKKRQEREKAEKLKRQLEELKRKEEQRRIEEEQRRKEELEKLEQEREKAIQEIQKIEEEIQKPETEVIEELQKKSRHISVFGGLGLGTSNIPLNQVYNYINYFKSYLTITGNYDPNALIVMRELPNWNWSGDGFFGLRYRYQFIEFDFFLKTFYQNVNPKLYAIPNRNLLNVNLYELLSETRYQQKQYQNLFSNFSFRYYTFDLFSLFWNYIFPYFEVGYVSREFTYSTALNYDLVAAELITLNNFSVSRLVSTNQQNNQKLRNQGIYLTVPFRFLKIFTSDFLFEFHYVFSGNSNMKQSVIERNINNLQVKDTLLLNSNYTGSYRGSFVSFVWQNEIPSKSDNKRYVFFRISKLEYLSKFKNINAVSLIIRDKFSVSFINEILLIPYNLLDRNLDIRDIKESYTIAELGFTYQYNL
ncbi:MAG: hypothetical protein NZ853_07835 [Leptospiraceae bacterium]|nr:hypothetical protein [Leptospiraceae bacterium]